VTIVEFLAAQLGERQRTAEAAADGGDGQWAAGTHRADECRIEGDGITIYDEGGHNAEQAAFIAANDPAFVLADTAARRRIVEVVEALLADFYSPDAGQLADAVLELLALPFADRPGYDEAWRP
jgi:hypothetical protein